MFLEYNILERKVYLLVFLRNNTDTSEDSESSPGSESSPDSESSSGEGTDSDSNSNSSSSDGSYELAKSNKGSC